MLYPRPGIGTVRLNAMTSVSPHGRGRDGDECRGRPQPGSEAGVMPGCMQRSAPHRALPLSCIYSYDPLSCKVGLPHADLRCSDCAHPDPVAHPGSIPLGAARIPTVAWTSRTTC